MPEPTASTSQRFVSLLTRDSLALVLAGGRGARLGGLSAHRVKPAVPFGGKYRLIDFPVSNCMNSGIRRVCVLTQYKSHTLIRHLQEAWSFLQSEFNEFVEVLPAQQRTGEGWYAGTADAVYQNLEIIDSHDPEFVLILGGDDVYRMDYGTMLGFHFESGADVTVGCVEMPQTEARGFSVMEVDDTGRVLQYRAAPREPDTMPGPNPALVSMGIYVFNAEYLVACLHADQGRSGSSHDLGRDVLPAAIAAGAAVRAFTFRDPAGNLRGYWRHVGTLSAYWRANLELTTVTPPLDLYDRSWPIWTRTEQAPPAKFVFDTPGRCGRAVDSLVSGGCVISGAALRRSLLFTFVRVEEGTLVEDSVILPGATIGPRCRLRRAIVEACCQLPEGTVAGEDLAADRQRFEVTEDGIVLITPEMLGQKQPQLL